MEEFIQKIKESKTNQRNQYKWATNDIATWTHLDASWEHMIPPSRNSSGRRRRNDVKCAHKRYRTQCRLCAPLCPHNMKQYRCEFCPNNRAKCEHKYEEGNPNAGKYKSRSNCQNCKTKIKCEHDIMFEACIKCEPHVCEVCELTTTRNGMRTHYKSQKHSKNQEIYDLKKELEKHFVK